MIIIVLLLILLVIAWPLVVAIFSGLFWIIAMNWEVSLAIFAVSVGYIVFLSRMSVKYNLKLGGKMGEALDPTKPAGMRVQKPTKATLPPPFADRHREPEKIVRRFDER